MIPSAVALEFFEACIPPRTTHHSKRIVKVGKFARLADSDKLNAAKDTLDALILRHRPQAPVSGPVRLCLVFTWPFRASEPKRVKSGPEKPHTSKPDCSNLAKTLEDRLVKMRFIEDDAQVAELIVSKLWGSKPGIYVRIERLGEGQ